MNGRKGFTLVEMAIVLVIIGILLVITLKGKSLIDAAKTKAEIARLSKIKTSVETYFTKYDSLPGITTSGDAVSSKSVYDALLDEEVASPKDFDALGGTYHWVFVGCNSGNGTGVHDKTWILESIKPGAHLCAYISSDQPDASEMDQASTDTLINPQLTGVFICEIEKGLDDSSAHNGSGRFVDGKSVNTGVGKDSFKCNDKDVVNQGVLSYVYELK